MSNNFNNNNNLIINSNNSTRDTNNRPEIDIQLFNSKNYNNLIQNEVKLIVESVNGVSGHKAEDVCKVPDVIMDGLSGHKAEVSFLGKHSEDTRETEKKTMQKRTTDQKCNIKECKTCDPNKPKLSKREVEEIKANMARRDPNKPRRAKFCLKNCSYCRRRIQRDLEEDFDRALQIRPQPKVRMEPLMGESITTSPHNPDNNGLPFTEEAIKRMRNQDFTEVEIEKDGNCFFKAAIESAKLPEHLHLELRSKTADLIKSDNTIWDGIFDEASEMTKEDFVNRLKANGTFAGYLEAYAIAKACRIWVAILLKDMRYQENPWQIVKSEDERAPEAIIFLSQTGRIIN